MARGDRGDKSLVRFPSDRVLFGGSSLFARGRGSAKEILVNMRLCKRLGLFAGALVIAGLSSASMADVQYYTVGEFGPTPASAPFSISNGAATTLNGPDMFGIYTGASQTSSLTYTFSNGDSATITYVNNFFDPTNGVHDLPITPGQTGFDDLGSFELSSSALNSDQTPPNALNNETFNLTIYQVDPASGQATFYGSMSGSIIVNPPHRVLNGVQPPLGITFSPTSFTIPTNPSVIYSLGIPGQTYPGGEVDLSSNVTTIEATITATPLPATAGMGLVLFGVIGATGALNSLRRRRLAAI